MTDQVSGTPVPNADIHAIYFNYLNPFPPKNYVGQTDVHGEAVAKIATEKFGSISVRANGYSPYIAVGFVSEGHLSKEAEKQSDSAEPALKHLQVQISPSN